MPNVQHSIDIRVPAHIAYDRLARFEDYPRFIGEVEAVRRLDDTHLHWTTRMADRAIEWDAEITEQEPGSCIAWHSTGGPTNGGRVEVQAAGPDASRVTLTLESAHEQVPGSPAGNSGEGAALRLQPDMARLKDFIEGRGTGEQREGVQQESRSTESDYSLSQPTGDEIDEGPFSVSEEISLDQQSDTARHVGQISQDAGAQPAGETPASEAMSKAMRRNVEDTKEDPKLKQSIERAVPPSE
jgi:hypothetical protein